eukprot:jgi/Bigna1/126679/aug1.3_g1387
MPGRRPLQRWGRKLSTASGPLSALLLSLFFVLLHVQQQHYQHFYGNERLLRRSSKDNTKDDNLNAQQWKMGQGSTEREGAGGKKFRFHIPVGTSYVDYIRRYLVNKKKDEFEYVENVDNETSLDYYDINGNNRKTMRGLIANRMFDKRHLCQKHRLAEHLCGYQNDFVPETAIIRKGVWTQVPRDFFRKANTTQGRRSVFFLKDSHRDNGKGVRVSLGISSSLLSKIDKKRTYVLQRHVDNVMLWESAYKFDLRMFSLAVFRPGEKPKFYIYPHGYCRVNPTKWERDTAKKSLQITNVSFFKRQNSSYLLVPTANFTGFMPCIYERIKRAIALSCIKTQEAMHSQNRKNRHCGYQLFAFDFLIDNDQKPWLLEVNASPGCSRNRRPQSMVDTLQEMFDQGNKVCSLEKKKKQKEKEMGEEEVC